jgi:hypothetical protein
LVLVLGVVGLVLGCFPVGIVAWVLGIRDLSAMNAGRMDPSGRGMTLAGKILGIIGTVLPILILVLIAAMTAIGTKVQR